MQSRQSLPSLTSNSKEKAANAGVEASSVAGPVDPTETDERPNLSVLGLITGLASGRFRPRVCENVFQRDGRQK